MSEKKMCMGLCTKVPASEKCRMCDHLARSVKDEDAKQWVNPKNPCKCHKKAVVNG